MVRIRSRENENCSEEIRAALYKYTLTQKRELKMPILSVRDYLIYIMSLQNSLA